MKKCFFALVLSVLFLANNSLSAFAQSDSWVKNGNNLYYQNGNVGINNPNPQYSLDIGNRIARLQGNLPGFLLTDNNQGGKTWGLFSGSPAIGDFKLRDFESGMDRLIIKGSTGYLESNTRLIYLNGNLPGLVLSDKRTSGGDYAIFSGSPSLGDFKIRNNSQGKDKFVIYKNGGVCLGNCN